MELPFKTETDLERALCADPDWRTGAAWGTPRPGHPEGSVANHVADVLAAVERVATSPDERRKLRLVAIVHDAMKHRVERDRPATGDNHHAMRARRFAEAFLQEPDVLDVIELHDEAYNAWRAASNGREKRARERLDALLARLGSALPLYRRFYAADNSSAGKSAEPFAWFEQELSRRGL